MWCATPLCRRGLHVMPLIRTVLRVIPAGPAESCLDRITGWRRGRLRGFRSAAWLFRQRTVGCDGAHQEGESLPESSPPDHVIDRKPITKREETVFWVPWRCGQSGLRPGVNAGRRSSLGLVSGWRVGRGPPVGPRAATVIRAACQFRWFRARWPGAWCRPFPGSCAGARHPAFAIVVDAGLFEGV